MSGRVLPSAPLLSSAPSATVHTHQPLLVLLLETSWRYFQITRHHHYLLDGEERMQIILLQDIAAQFIAPDVPANVERSFDATRPSRRKEREKCGGKFNLDLHLFVRMKGIHWRIGSNRLTCIRWGCSAARIFRLPRVPLSPSARPSWTFPTRHSGRFSCLEREDKQERNEDPFDKSQSSLIDLSTLNFFFVFRHNAFNFIYHQ